MASESRKISIRRRAIGGGVILGLGSGAEGVLRFLRNVILTRILLPDDFGLMAIVLAVNMAFESFTDVGIKEAIIQNPDSGDPAYLNSAWFFATGRAVVLYGCGYLLAPTIAGFYENPDLTSMLRIAFLSVIFNGVTSSRLYLSLKRMEYWKWVASFHGGSFLGLILAITLALKLKTVWALVFGFTSESLFRCLLSFIFCPFLPGFVFQKEAVGSLLKFAKGIFGLPLLTFIFMRADIFFAGKIVTKHDLGLYSMAIALGTMPFQFVSSVINRLMLPIFSEVQNDHAKVNRYVLMATAPMYSIGLPMATFLLFFGGTILQIVYGTPYGSVGAVFALIFTSEVFRTANMPLAAVYISQGSPELHRLFAFVRAVAVCILLYPVTIGFGLTGTASAVLFSLLLAMVLQIRRMNGLTGLDLGSYFRLLGKGLLFAIIPVPFFILTVKLAGHSALLGLAVGIALLLVVTVFAVLTEKKNLEIIRGG